MASATSAMRRISSLDDDHQIRLRRAVHNVISTSLAQTTLAQIIDGLPLSDVERDKYNKISISYEHPLHERHKSLCPGALERLQELSGELHLEELEFPADLMFDFNSLPPGSVAFNTRLIELIARVIHELAATLHENETKLHDKDDLTTWVPSKDDDPLFWFTHPNGMPPTLLRHQQYTAYRLYPRRVADGVGYWAEARILGGVVLFDRRNAKTNPEANPHDIYFHSDRSGVTYRIYALVEEQKRKLLEFLNTDHPQSMIDEISPLPILGDMDNRQRVDPEESSLRTGIYRDPWERKATHPEKDRRRARKDIFSGIDYTSWEEFQASVRRGGQAEREWLAKDEDDDDMDDDDMDDDDD